jgi:hypothetical protein
LNTFQSSGNAPSEQPGKQGGHSQNGANGSTSNGSGNGSVDTAQPLKDTKVELAPNPRPVNGKDGMVDAKNGPDRYHVIEMPGKAETVAEMKTGDKDVKVNMPLAGPVADVFSNGPVKDLLGKPKGENNGRVELAPVADVSKVSWVELIPVDARRAAQEECKQWKHQQWKQQQQQREQQQQ